jgi:hypothetical protein
MYTGVSAVGQVYVPGGKPKLPELSVYVLASAVAVEP